jgi:aarF domain-containing kinase
VDLLIDVHGHQIFIDGCFNGDPHPGNVLELSNGKLGLIDYGQTRRLTTSERLSFARVVLALSTKPMNATNVSEEMRNSGFETKFGNDEITAKYGALFFDDDSDSKRMGCATPQLYLMKLSSIDPLTRVPDAAGK